MGQKDHIIDQKGLKMYEKGKKPKIPKILTF